MDTISFARGIPAPECLPIEELADCARAAILSEGRTALSYGTGSGYQPLREWVAERHGVEPDRVLLTNGGLQGFVFLAQHLCTTQPGCRVLVEAPTYDRPLKILHSLGADVVPLAMDEQGLDPGELEHALAEGPKPALVYTIPTFQNPSGRTLSAERRQRIADLAREYDVLMLEDDPYGLVRFEGDAPPSLFSLDPDRIAYASSFSKTIAPGVRVGYFVLPPELHAALEAIAVSTYISPVMLAEATIWEFIRRGNFEPNLARVRGLLRARRDAMLEALDEHFGGSGATWSRPEGGYFVWLDIPGVESGDLLERATAAGVTFVRGSDFGGALTTARLAFSFVSPDEIRAGVARLAALVPAAAPAV